jgi:adenylate cyclase class IV
MKLRLIDYDLKSQWQSHALIADLRERLSPHFPKGVYDPQDLEHQALFRLTTFAPDAITDEVVRDVMEEQFLILKNRLAASRYDLEHIFRGLSGKHRDLNAGDRLMLSRSGEVLTAENGTRSFKVDFRRIEDDGLIALFTSELHYIHHGRPKGETFGLFFAGDDIPWAIETTEPSVVAKDYKRDALSAHGIDPNKAVELTRFYTLPGAPRNAISVMDGLVSRHYKQKGIEALVTSTMPMYSKTKSTTIAGGLNSVLLVKDLRHRFLPVEIEGRACYRHVVQAPEDAKGRVLTNHPLFPTSPVVEVYKLINPRSGVPHPALADGKKTIHMDRRKTHVEKEAKFAVTDIAAVLPKLRAQCVYSRTEYIKDVIWGSADDTRKIRLRVTDAFGARRVEAIRKYRVQGEAGLKTEVEEFVYAGESREDAVAAIQNQGAYKEENSYEKIRVVYACGEAEVTLDIYPFGAWIEIEGIPAKIWDVAEKLGYKKDQAVDSGADDLYVAWNAGLGLKESWDVRFGLNQSS